MNKIILTGNICGEHDKKTSKAGEPFLTNSIAVYRDKENTDFFNFIAFKKTAKYIGENIKKGEKVLIEGSLQINKWQDKNGNNRYSNEVIVHKIEKLSFDTKEKKDNNSW